MPDLHWEPSAFIYEKTFVHVKNITSTRPPSICMCKYHINNTVSFVRDICTALNVSP